LFIYLFFILFIDFYCPHAEQILPKLLAQHKTLITYSLACSLLLDV